MLGVIWLKFVKMFLKRFDFVGSWLFYVGGENDFGKLGCFLREEIFMVGLVSVLLCGEDIFLKILLCNV